MLISCPMEAEILPRSFVTLQVKCTYVSSDRKETSFVPSSEAFGTRYEFYENPCNWNRDTAVKMHSTPSKVPLINDWSQPNLCRVCRICMKYQTWIFMKIPPMKAEMQAWGYFAVRVLYLVVLADRNQTYFVSGEYEWNTIYEFSWKSH
jgi:hypothetical protein